jgi:eukaryotic-like serine/threonine-protein kinase
MQPDDDKTRAVTVLAKGTVINHYRIVEKIGAGGMGEVYLAEDTKLNRNVALKFLSQHLCQDEGCRQRFEREAQAAAKLDHPNIVAVHEVGEFQSRPFFSMQHVEGQSLKQVNAGKTLPLDRIVEIGIQVCDGLQAAHEKGITHRDIKPSNILIDSHGRARIVDFGLASVMGLDHLTKTGSTLGTIGYMSPEQVRGDKVDHRTDLFSFGVVLHEMITGHAPFKADSEAATLHAIANTKPELLARFRRDVPVELQTIIDKALEKDVATRYQHADDIATDLKRLSSAAIAQQAPRRSLRNQYLVTSAVVLLLVIVGYWGVTKFLTKDGQKPVTARKMLAVLPFKNMSIDPDQEFFSDGLTEDLTASLSKVQSLCVVSRSSSMTFKGSQQTIPEIAKALGVRYVVEGSVRRAGKELRITAQLIDASKDAHLWANSYTGTFEDVFDMQDSVTQAIVAGVSVRLTPEETRRLHKRSFDNAFAYEYYLKGRDEIFKGTLDPIERGLRYFQQGLDIAGDNALIYCGMAWGCFALVNTGFAQDKYISDGIDYAQKALALDTGSVEAYAILGSFDNAFLGNQRRAVENFKRALALESSNEDALWGLANVYSGYVGKPTEAKATIDQYSLAFPMKTLRQHYLRGWAQFFEGNFQEALGHLRVPRIQGSEESRDPASEFIYALTLSHCDSVGAALSVCSRVVNANPTSSLTGLFQLLRRAMQDDSTEADQPLPTAAQLTCKRDPQFSYFVGAILAKSGAREQAYSWLEIAVERGFINYAFWQKDPFLSSIRSEDRFKKLIERVKYEWEHFEV